MSYLRILYKPPFRLLSYNRQFGLAEFNFFQPIFYAIMYEMFQKYTALSGGHNSLKLSEPSNKKLSASPLIPVIRHIKFTYPEITINIKFPLFIAFVRDKLTDNGRYRSRRRRKSLSSNVQTEACPSQVRLPAVMFVRLSFMLFIQYLALLVLHILKSLFFLLMLALNFGLRHFFWVFLQFLLMTLL
jgi:hypothetical protein